MSTQETQTKRHGFWKRLFFSETLLCRSHGGKIAFIAAFTAFSVVANLFFEFKLMDTQYSLTIAVSALIGAILGPAFGFVACFLGDLLGFLVNSGGFLYMPFIGISMGLTAFFAGLLVGLRLPFKGAIYVKLAVLCLFNFAVCTVAINTTAFWVMYAKNVPYFTYLFTRLIVKGQIFSSLVNFALIFLFIPMLGKIKPLKIKIK